MVTLAAAEPVALPLEFGTLKTRDGKVLEGAKIIGHDAVGVKVVHAGGTARVAFERLPKDLADRFPRDREAAKDQLEKEARQEAAHDRAVDRAIVTKETDGPEEGPAGSPVEGLPELKGDPEVKIAQLEAYIRRLETGIEKANQVSQDALDRAAKYASSASTSVTRYDSKGRATTREVTNKSRLKRAKFQREKAEREQEKIKRARELIADARKEIVELTKHLKATR